MEQSISALRLWLVLKLTVTFIESHKANGTTFFLFFVSSRSPILFIYSQQKFATRNNSSKSSHEIDNEL